MSLIETMQCTWTCTMCTYAQRQMEQWGGNTHMQSASLTWVNRRERTCKRTASFLPCTERNLWNCHDCEYHTINNWNATIVYIRVPSLSPSVYVCNICILFRSLNCQRCSFHLLCFFFAISLSLSLYFARCSYLFAIFLRVRNFSTDFSPSLSFTLTL